MVKDNLSHNKIDERANRSEMIYQQLKVDIITCKFEPGQILSEGQLSENFNVSKTPVREALSRLHNDGLVSLLPRKGYIITNLTIRDVQEIFELRLILERAATMLAAERITDAEIANLESYLGIDFDPKDRNTYYRYIQANQDFHMSIARASRNQRLLEYLERILNDALRILYIDLTFGSGIWAWDRDHHNILNALKSHDKEAAGKAVEKALAESRLRLLSVNSH